MAPSVVSIDFSDDFSPAAAANSNGISSQRTLLLAAPSVAAHEEKIKSLFSEHSRKTTDLQMLDRLAGGLISLPLLPTISSSSSPAQTAGHPSSWGAMPLRRLCRL